MQPPRGAFVSQMTPESLNEPFFAMGKIEAICAHLSAIIMNPLEHGLLKVLQGDMGACEPEGLETSYAKGNSEIQVIFLAAPIKR